MPILKNPRHERFAQELAMGKSQTDAYLSAGYDADPETARRAGSRLMTNEDITARVSELQQNGADKAEVTVLSLLAEAEQARALAIADKQFAAAIAAIREKGVLSGRRVERSERGQPGEFESMNADELRDSIARDLETLGRQDLAAALIGGKRTAGSQLN